MDGTEIVAAQSGAPEKTVQSRLYGARERLALMAGGAMMLGIVAASGWLSIVNEDRLRNAAETQRVRAITVDLLQALTSAETGQRGYLLTGKEGYLLPYNDAVRRVPALLAELQPPLRNEPDFPDLQHAVTAKLNELGHTIDLARAGQHDAALAVVQSDVGQQFMTRARTIVAGLATRQRAALNHDLQISRAGARAVVAVDLAAIVVLALLAVFVTQSSNRYVDRLRSAREALKSANAELEAGRDRLEAAVSERTAELVRANEEIQRFAYIISHDLRAPLLNIIGFSNELEAAAATLNSFVETHLAASDIAIPENVRQASEEDLPEAVRFIQTSTAKMDRLINAILRLSREGRRVLTPERLQMEALVTGVVDSVRHQAAQADADVTIGKLPDLVSDRIAVEQIFSNLVENALKYLVDSRPGRIEITGERQGRSAVFAVKDNGRGITERDFERIFELFRRAGVQDRPGEGIGLAHVRALVRRLGGDITCHSRVGEGSTFLVHLPVVLARGASEVR